MLIKDVYSKDFYNKLASSLVKVLPNFDEQDFVNQMLSPSFLQMEWKERMHHTAVVFHHFYAVGICRKCGINGAYRHTI